MRALTVFLILATVATESSAQVCRGFPSQTKAPVSIGVGAAVTGEWSGGGASVGLGRSNGLFAQGGVGFDHNSFLKDKYLVLNLGYDMQTGQNKKYSVCPVVSASHLFGPNYPYYDGVTTAEWQSHANNFSGGVSFGGAFAIDDAINLLPYARVEVAYASETHTFAGVTSTLNQTYELLTVGAGFSISQRYTVQPWFAFPMSLKNADMSAGLAVRVSFLRK